MLEGRTPRFVSAAEITRHFGSWQDRAGQGPLIVTHHGRPRCVLLSMEDWQGPGATGLGGAEARAAVEHDLLSERIDALFLTVDGAGRIRGANGRAALHLGRPRSALQGLALADVAPWWHEGPVAAQLQRTLRTGEDGRLTVPFGDVRARVDIFAWTEGAALLIRPIEAEDRLDHGLARAAAVEGAAAAHGRIAMVELTPRGTIRRVDEAFASLSGFRPDRLPGVRLTDLLTVATRVAVGQAAESALGEARATAIDADLLVNGGDTQRVRIALSPLTEDYTVAGAIAIVTPAGDDAQSASGRKSGTDK